MLRSTRNSISRHKDIRIKGRYTLLRNDYKGSLGDNGIDLGDKGVVFTIDYIKDTKS